MRFFSSKILIFSLLTTISCVDPFEIEIKDNLNIVMVEGEITDENRLQFIKIYNSDYKYQIVNKSAIPGLKVKVLVNGSHEINLSDDSNGTYYFPTEFRAIPGNTYQLVFTNNIGNQYQSDIEQLQAVPPIDSVYDYFEKEGTRAFGKDVPSNNIFVDFKDSDLGQNYLQWTWKMWEKQSVCMVTPYYDLYCSNDCYEIFYNSEINILNDKFYNGKGINGNLIGKIPYYQYNGALLEIKQKSITERAYKFYKNLQNLSQKTGTLADSPPQLIGGNIVNINNKAEIVAGLFTVASVKTKNYWLSRVNAQGKGIPAGLLGRKVNIIPNGITAPCQSNKYQTPIKPEFWQE